VAVILLLLVRLEPPDENSKEAVEVLSEPAAMRCDSKGRVDEVSF